MSDMQSTSLRKQEDVFHRYHIISEITGKMFAIRSNRRSRLPPKRLVEMVRNAQFELQTPSC